MSDKILALITALLASFVTLFVGFAMCLSHMKEEAVRAGVAEWTCDPTTGKSTFDYIRPEKKHDPQRR